MEELKPKNEFNCAVCEETFTRDDEFTHKEALKEYAENGFIDKDIVSVCDDCYNMIMNSDGIEEAIAAWNRREQ